MNTDNTMRIKRLTNGVHISTVIRQSLSPILFSLVMDKINVNMNGYHMGHKKITILSSAYNNVFLAEDENNLQLSSPKALTGAKGTPRCNGLYGRVKS